MISEKFFSLVSFEKNKKLFLRFEFSLYLTQNQNLRQQKFPGVKLEFKF